MCVCARVWVWVCGCTVQNGALLFRRHVIATVCDIYGQMMELDENGQGMIDAEGNYQRGADKHNINLQLVLNDLNPCALAKHMVIQYFAVELGKCDIEAAEPYLNGDEDASQSGGPAGASAGAGAGDADVQKTLELASVLMYLYCGALIPTFVHKILRQHLAKWVACTTCPFPWVTFADHMQAGWPQIRRMCVSPAPCTRATSPPPPRARPPPPRPQHRYAPHVHGHLCPCQTLMQQHCRVAGHTHTPCLPA